MNAVSATLPATDALKRFTAGWTTRSPGETEAAGAAFSHIFPVDQALALHGSLGAGKTTFVRGLARGWGLAGPIPSPTFNYYFIYRGSRQLVHLDAYRLTRPGDVESLLIDEFLQSPWCLAIEWPENLGDRLSLTAWHLDFRAPDESTRVLTLRRSS